MSKEKLQEILQMTVEEKEEIYKVLTLDLHQINNDEDLTDWQKEELERRLKKIEDGKETFYTWEEVKQRLHNK